MDSKVSLFNWQQHSFIAGSHRLSTASCNLKVPNFFTLAEYEGVSFKMESSSFQFANATWCFRFKSEECKNDEETDEETDEESDEKNDMKPFHVYLVQLNSEIPEHNIWVKIALKDANDEEYDVTCAAAFFHKYGKVECIESFYSGKTPRDRRDTLTVFILLIFLEVDRELITTDKRVTTLSHDLKDMLINGQDHNITFTVSDKSFRAHQDILRSRSSVFRSMLSHDMLEKNTGVINVPDCEPNAFEQLLHYIYSGKVETIDENNMFGLYYAADKYNLAEVKEDCCEFIKKSLTVSSVCDALELATKHSDASLLDSAMNFFFDNVDDILLTVEWKLFMKENPTVANELYIKSLKKIRERQTS